MSFRTASVCTANPEAAATSDLLHRLAFDDEFRSRLEQSPAEVLSHYRLSVPSGTPIPLTLPTKEDARRLLADAVDRGAVRTASAPSIFAWIC